MTRLAAWLGLLASLAGTLRALLAPTVDWRHDVTAARATAIAEGKPLVLFFAADWDSASKEMRRVTLVDPEVRTLLHRRFVADIVDCTDEDDPEVARHWHDFHVLGTPTILVVDPDTLAEKARVDHFVEPEALAKVLEVAGAR